VGERERERGYGERLKVIILKSRLSFDATYFPFFFLCFLFFTPLVVMACQLLLLFDSFDFYEELDKNEQSWSAFRPFSFAIKRREHKFVVGISWGFLWGLGELGGSDRRNKNPALARCRRDSARLCQTDTEREINTNWAVVVLYADVAMDECIYKDGPMVE
jgi:hypothetical protein